MTVISTIITKRLTAHASDSLITPFGKHNKEERETQKTKIIPVRHFRGAMSYWGLATTTAGWNTLDWLRDRAGGYARKFDNPEEYAKALRAELNQQFSKISLQEPGQPGLGIHFTAYEVVDGYRIPEMFKISNWTDLSYSAVHPGGPSFSPTSASQ
jgi:hypothetical protein